MLIETSATQSHWDEERHVWYHGARWTETHVAKASIVVPNPCAPWAWWVGEARDPIIGGTGTVTWDAASKRGFARTRAEAVATARRESA